MSLMTQAEFRRLSRQDFAMRALNGGRLPEFQMSVDGVGLGVVCPSDATPEGAIQIIRRQLMDRQYGGPGSRHHASLIIARLVAGTADAIVAAATMFYQGKTEWSEEIGAAS